MANITPGYRTKPIEALTEVWRSTYSNLYDIYFYKDSIPLNSWMEGGDSVPWMCFRAEAVQLGDTLLNGEFIEALRRTLPTGYAPIKEVTISFRENQGYTVLKVLRDRFNLAFDRGTGRMIVGGPAAAKMTIVIALESPGKEDSAYAAAAVIYLYGALIQAIPAPRLSWKDSEAIVYDVKFWVDDVRYDAPGYVSGIDDHNPTGTFKDSVALGLQKFEWSEAATGAREETGITSEGTPSTADEPRTE